MKRRGQVAPVALSAAGYAERLRAVLRLCAGR